MHAPFFPKTLNENWWVLLTDKVSEAKKAAAAASPTPQSIETNIYSVEKVSDQSAVVTHEIKFMAPPRAGHYEMQLHIFSDCYMGLDRSFDVAYDVLPASELPQVELHPDDLALDNEPTLFEQLLAANADEDSSDDEDEPVEKKAIKNGNNDKKESYVVEDVDGDSDDN